MSSTKPSRIDRCVECGDEFSQPVTLDAFARDIFCLPCSTNPAICRQNEPPPPTPPGGWLAPTHATAATPDRDLLLDRAAAGDPLARRQLVLFE